MKNISFSQIVKDHFMPHGNFLPFFNSRDKQNEEFKVSLQGSFGNMWFFQCIPNGLKWELSIFTTVLFWNIQPNHVPNGKNGRKHAAVESA